MARDKSEKSTTEAKPERSEPIKPMPFPGESPTVALAMAAAQQYGLHEEAEKPARAQPKKRAATKVKTTKKAAAPKKKSSGSARKPTKRAKSSPPKGARKGK